MRGKVISRGQVKGEDDKYYYLDYYHLEGNRGLKKGDIIYFEPWYKFAEEVKLNELREIKGIPDWAIIIYLIFNIFIIVISIKW